jgi:hypothetical protein
MKKWRWGLPLLLLPLLLPLYLVTPVAEGDKRFWENYLAFYLLLACLILPIGLIGVGIGVIRARAWGRLGWGVLGCGLLYAAIFALLGVPVGRYGDVVFSNMIRVECSYRIAVNVYEIRSDNQQQDADEPGIPGVEVRITAEGVSGDQIVFTDSEGRAEAARYDYSCVPSHDFVRAELRLPSSYDTEDGLIHKNIRPYRYPADPGPYEIEIGVWRQ